MQEAAHDLKTRLLNTLDSDGNVSDTQGALEVIVALEKMAVTAEILEVTRLGRCVNELRKKTSSADLAKRAKKLVKKWQKLIKTESCGSRASTPNGLTPIGVMATVGRTARLLAEAAARVGESPEGCCEAVGQSLESVSDLVAPMETDTTVASSLTESALHTAVAATDPSSFVLQTSPEYRVYPRPEGESWTRKWHGVDGRYGSDGEWYSWTMYMPAQDGSAVASPYVFLD